MDVAETEDRLSRGGTRNMPQVARSHRQPAVADKESSSPEPGEGGVALPTLGFGPGLHGFIREDILAVLSHRFLLFWQPL